MIHSVLQVGLHFGILNPQPMIDAAGTWGLAVVMAIIFAETGLLIGFFLPGDTLLFLTGVLVVTGSMSQPLWLVILAVAAAAVLGDQLGFVIGRSSGPAVFDRRESGFFSRATVQRTQRFFDRFGPVAVSVARFVPVVRTFAPVAAGVGHMRRRVFAVFNAVGALAWSAVMTLAGFLLGRVPGVAAFVTGYLDVILAAVVVLSIGPVVARSIVVRHRRRREWAQAQADERGSRML